MTGKKLTKVISTYEACHTKTQYKNFHNFQKNESWAIYLTKLLFLAQIFQWIVAQLRTNNSITTSTPNESITIQFDICSQK